MLKAYFYINGDIAANTTKIVVTMQNQDSLNAAAINTGLLEAQKVRTRVEASVPDLPAGSPSAPAPVFNPAPAGFTVMKAGFLGFERSSGEYPTFEAAVDAARKMPGNQTVHPFY